MPPPKPIRYTNFQVISKKRLRVHQLPWLNAGLGWEEKLIADLQGN
jgi:hypothetical protein